MTRICYVPREFSGSSLDIIAQANAIISEYAAAGYDLTLRQLYYQFVARDLLPNTVRQYKRLGSIVNDARLAGLVSWDAIVDRTRELKEASHWDGPAAIVRSCAQQFRVDKWEGQTYRPEVWIEKDALVGVIAGVCRRLDVPYFACRGYTSQSEMWSAAQRLADYRRGRQRPYVVHLGDHDPSGIDMTRDIDDRLSLFIQYEGLASPVVERIALNMDQVEEYAPPPNPAKLSDSRARGYIRKWGADSWELDALEPQVISELVEQAVLALRDEAPWQEKVAEEERARELLQRVSDRWDEVVDAVDEEEEE